MADISTHLSELLASKADMNSALIEKGSEPAGGLTTYADAIRAIKLGDLFKCRVEFPSEMVDIAVFMGGVDVTDDITSDGVGSIPEITGDLVITVAEKMLISYGLSNVVSSNSRDFISAGRAFSTVLSFEEGYEFSRVIVTMGGADITSTAFDSSTGEINIPSVTGNVRIEASASLKTLQITNNLTNAVSNNILTEIIYGRSYSATITAAQGYDLGTVSVTMGGTPVSVVDGVINIPSVTGDIVVTANATIKSFSVSNVLTLATTNNAAITAEYGSTYSATLSTEEGYELSSVQINMGGTNITSSAYNNGVITINNVTGDIVITAVATIKTFSIAYNLTRIVSDNTTASVNYGDSFEATLSPEAGYKLGTVSVTMGGTPVSVVDGVISIPSVTGDIVITAAALADEVSITNNLTNSTNSNSSTAITFGAPYAAIISAAEYHNLTSVQITMGGVDITDTAYSNGAINIASVTGELVITAVSEIRVATITYNLTSVNSSNSAANANHGTSFETTLTSTKKNWSVNSITVMMGGADVTDTVVAGTSISIPVVTGNIVITATASRAKDIGVVETTNNVISINDGELPSGVYTMRYEDVDGNPIGNESDITTFTI